MRSTAISLALEAIAFQNGDLYQDLIDACRDLRGFGKGMSDRDFWASDEVQSIARVVKAHTHMTISLVDGTETGPMVIFPAVDESHPLRPNWIKQFIIDGYRYDGAADVRRIMKTMESNLVQGAVDLKHSKVSGVFAELQSQLLMPRSMFENDLMGTVEQVAAIVLHEIGHIFTVFEYAGRTITTNNVLAGMLRAMDKTVIADERTTVFAKGAELMRMSKEQREAVLNAKSEAEVTCIVIDSAVQLSRSELGLNIYDITGSEQLADQFAARHGAGRTLVLALDKLERFYKKPLHWFLRMIGFIFQVVGWIFIAAMLHVVLLATFLFMYAIVPEYEIPEHNTLKGRYMRILHECTEQLKNRSLSPEQKKAILADYEAIKAIADKVEDSLPLLRKFSYFVNPRYRNARKFHLLQNDLEALGASSLFADAAKLSTL